MTRDHKIRILVSGMKGKARAAEIMRLLKRPRLIRQRLYIRILMLRRK